MRGQKRGASGEEDGASKRYRARERRSSRSRKERCRQQSKNDQESKSKNKAGMRKNNDDIKISLTLSQRMRKRQRHHRPPPHRLLYRLRQIRQAFIIRPNRRPLLAHHTIDLRLSLPDHIPPLRHGMHEGNDNRRRRVAAALHHRAPQEIQLVLGQAELGVLVQHHVHEGGLVDARLAPGLDQREHAAVQAAHLAPDAFAPRHPAPQPRLRDPVEEREDVDRGRVARFHQLRPILHHVVQLRHVRCVDVWGADPEQQRHDDAVAVPLWMQHVLLRVQGVVAHHLHGFRVLSCNVRAITFALHEGLVDDLSARAPEVAVLHDQNMIAFGHELRGDVAEGPVAVFAGFLVDELFDEATVCEDYGGCGAEFE